MAPGLNQRSPSARRLATTAGAEPPSFTALATYLPAVGAMACPMQASIKRPCIAAWSRRERLE